MLIGNQRMERTMKLQATSILCIGGLLLLGADIDPTIESSANKSRKARAAVTDPCSLATGWRIPQDVSEITDDLCARFAWDTFIAFNWPRRADGFGGEPDKTISICDTNGAPTVWSTLMTKEQAYLPEGEDPGTWENPTYPTPMYGDDPQNMLPLIGALAKASVITNITGAFDQADSENPLIDQNGNYLVYQIFLNQAEFSYITQNKYYDKRYQLLAFEDGTSGFKGMPMKGYGDDNGTTYDLPDYAQQGVVELKVAWKQLTQDEIDSGRFYTQEIYYVSNLTEADPACGPVTVGLVGMHVQRLTTSMASTWFWATFEHIDNVETSVPGATPSFNPGPDSAYPPPYPDGYTCVDNAPQCPPLKVEDGTHDVCEPFDANIVNVSSIPELAPSALISSINAEYQDALPAPWKYYKLIGTVHPADSDGPACIMPDPTNMVNTAYLTNTTMESYTQYMNDLTFTKCNGDTSKSISCIDCHAAGLPWGAPTDGEGFPLITEDNLNGRKYQIFSFLLLAATRACPGDVEVNGIVDVNDILLFLADFGCQNSCLADANDDFTVDINDLLVIINSWGTCE